MNTLYDSETFSVTHMRAHDELDNLMPLDWERSKAAASVAMYGAQTLPALERHGFEIVDKRSGKEVYLDGSWAEIFQQHIMAWQVNIPTQQEVEDTLAQYAELAQNPVVIH